MSTTITTRLERRIEANPRGLTIIETSRGDMIQAALTPDEARQIAAALTADQGGQWTRDELSKQLAKVMSDFQDVEDERDAAERERDAAVERAEKAEQLIPAYAMVDVWMALGRDSIHFDDWYDEHGYADAWAELTAAVREARTAPAVTHADVEKALDTGIRGTTDGGLIDQDTSIPSGECVRLAVDAVCDLFGIEAEQDIDPVEAKARELYEVGNPGTVGMWESIHDAFKDGYRRIARHVLGQEADQ